MSLFPLRVTVLSVTPAEDYHNVWLQVESADPSKVYCGGNLGLMVADDLADQYVVGQSQLLEDVPA